MHKAQSGDSGSFSPETPGCLALHKEHGASVSIRVHMDGCRIFWKGAKSADLKIKIPIGSRDKAQ